jgi:dienelactone hydrolase
MKCVTWFMRKNKAIPKSGSYRFAKYITAVLVVVLPVVKAVSQSKKPPLGIRYGQYHVGLRQEKALYNDSLEITITSWYPAEKSDKPSLTLKDYFVFDGIRTVANFDSTVSGIICGSCKIENKDLQKIINAATVAKKDPVPIEHHFPMLVWSNRHGTVYYQFAMSEYLASHGFVVFAVSRVHPRLPLPWEVDTSERQGLLQQHNADLNTLFSRIKNYRNVDTTQLALFSWSYGGESAILAQQSHPGIDIVFGFSSINFKRPFFLLNEFDKHLSEKKLDVPYVLFYEDTNRFGVKFTTDLLHPKHLNKSKLIQFPDLIHGNFNYIEGYLPSSVGLYASHPWANRGKSAMLGYEAICRLTLLLLRSHFDKKDDKYIDAEIRRIRSEIPVNFIQTKK